MTKYPQGLDPVAPHDCYTQTFYLDPKDQKWKCPVCHNVYVPPNDRPKPKVDFTKRWKPWTVEVGTLVLPEDGTWRPENLYPVVYKKKSNDT